MTRPTRHRPKRRLVGPLALAAALLAGGCSETDDVTDADFDDVSPPVIEDGGDAVGRDEVEAVSIPDLVDEVSPSVATVRTEGGEGSAVVFDAGGVLVTNAHVVGDSETVEVTFADATSVEADVVAVDQLTDVAVLRTDLDGLPALPFADDLPEVGELAVAIGNPLGFEGSVTAGIVSGLERALPGAATAAPSLVDLIQTDAPISPGNSGGALVGADGEVIGINVAYIPPAGGAVAIGFAIPAPTVVDVVEDLLADGTVEHPFLGVVADIVTPQLAERFDMPSDQGLLVSSVVERGPADAAGIRPGDVLLELDGEALETREALLGALRTRDPGEVVELTVRSDGDERTVEVELGERPPP